jgi:hypothetical protein
MRPGGVDTTENEMSTNVSLVSACQLCPTMSKRGEAHRKRYCLSIVMAVTTRAGRPCDKACSSRLEAIRLVTNLNISLGHKPIRMSSLSVSGSTSTATSDLRSEVVDLSVSLMPKGRIVELTFSQFLSATIDPPVALVSAPRQTPSSSPESPPPNLTPTMVVPVEVAYHQFLFRGGPSTEHTLW